MTTTTFDYPAELATALGKRPAEAAQELHLMAALKLFEVGRVSSGLAAKIAGMSRIAFLMECGRYHVSVFQQTPDELRADMEAASNASGC